MSPHLDLPVTPKITAYPVNYRTLYSMLDGTILHAEQIDDDHNHPEYGATVFAILRQDNQVGLVINCVACDTEFVAEGQSRDPRHHDIVLESTVKSIHWEKDLAHLAIWFVSQSTSLPEDAVRRIREVLATKALFQRD